MDTCRNGHPRTPENLTIEGGQNRCRPCLAAKRRRFRANHPGALLTSKQIEVLRRLERGVAEGELQAWTVLALARRGLIRRKAGRWDLTDAGRVALTDRAGAR